MRDILILGANSQVGLELAMLIRQYSQAPVQCIVRNDSAAVMLRALSLRCEVCDTTSDAFKRLAKDARVAVDCSWPSGQISHQIVTIRHRIQQCISAIPRESVYVNLSSMNAFGWREGETVLKAEIFAKSPYAYVKRKAEQFVAQYSSQRGCKCINLRLGQIHGALQSISRVYEGIPYEAGPLSVLDAPAPIVWVEAVARYLCELWSDPSRSKQSREPLVAIDCTPWRHQDLHQLYAQMTGRTAVCSLKTGKIAHPTSFIPQKVLGDLGYMVHLAVLLADKFPFIEDKLYKKKRLSGSVERPSIDGYATGFAISELDGTMFNSCQTPFSTSKEQALETFSLVRNEVSALRAKLSSGQGIGAGDGKS